MSCVCGSFQCTCREKCTCMAEDCPCEKCIELRSDRPRKSNGSEGINSPTRGTTTLLTDLKISDNRSTTVNRDLLYPGWPSYAKPPSSSSELYETTDVDTRTHSSPYLIKTSSPKRKHSTTMSPQSNIKRYSPCKANQSEMLPKTLDMGACPPKTKEYSRKSEDVDKSGTVDPSTNESKSQAVALDSSTPQDSSVIHDLKLSRGTRSTKYSSGSKNTTVIQKNTKMSTEPKYTSCPTFAEVCKTGKQFLSAQHINKPLTNRDSKFEVCETYSYKYKSSWKKEPTSWQAESRISSKSKPVSVESSEVSRSTSKSGRPRGASASARPTSGVQPKGKSRTSNTSESSQQASSKRQSSLVEKPDPFAPIKNLGIPRCFVDIDAMDEIFQRMQSVQKLSETWVADEDNESSFAPRETNSETANSSTDSATSPEIAERNPLVANPESSIFGESYSDASTSDSAENQVVPNID